MRALLIEDEEQTAKSIELMLKSLGYECVWAESGEAGVAYALRDKFDIILLDVMLPKMDGYEVLQELRATNVETPVLLQSGLADRKKAAEGMSLGVADYLIKPYSKLELGIRIGTALDRARFGSAPSNGGSQAPEIAQEGADEPKGKPTSMGQIINRGTKCDMECLVLSLSDKGAAIEPADALHCPASFTLEMDDGSTYSCKVCWRYRNKLGVRFLEASVAA